MGWTRRNHLDIFCDAVRNDGLLEGKKMSVERRDGGGEAGDVSRHLGDPRSSGGERSEKRLGGR